MAPKLLNLQTENNLGNGRICFHVWTGLKWVWCSLCSFSSNYHKMELWPKIVQLHDFGTSSSVLGHISLVLITVDYLKSVLLITAGMPCFKNTGMCFKLVLLHEGAVICTLKIAWLYKITYHEIPLNKVTLLEHLKYDLIWKINVHSTFQEHICFVLWGRWRGRKISHKEWGS